MINMIRLGFAALPLQHRPVTFVKQKIVIWTQNRPRQTYNIVKVLKASLNVGLSLTTEVAQTQKKNCAEMTLYTPVRNP